ncbi:MAG: helix-turn-helix domain-containing protein [Lachnospiraceae bacterium]|nr:helix-turn-helix domain-containing protein [Lachnospiraceae bacterium]
MDVVDRINLRLAEIGKTGAEMSRALNLSNSIYSQWNTRKTRPSKKTLARVAEYLGVTVEYLLTGASAAEHPTWDAKLAEDMELPIQDIFENPSRIRKKLLVKREELSADELRLLKAYRAASGKRKEALLDLLED